MNNQPEFKTNIYFENNNNTTPPPPQKKKQTLKAKASFVLY